MIATLNDAWNWYASVQRLVGTMARLGQKHWSKLPWDSALGRDEQLKGLDTPEIDRMSRSVNEDLDDLCVLLLFSVFESIVREHVIQEIKAEALQVRQIALQRAITDLKESIEEGSFFKVLDPYKKLDANLVEEVNQVRRYRNWVAHGRRSSQPAKVDPTTAYDRLNRFLDRI